MTSSITKEKYYTLKKRQAPLRKEHMVPDVNDKLLGGREHMAPNINDELHYEGNAW